MALLEWNTYNIFQRAKTLVRRCCYVNLVKCKTIDFNNLQFNYAGEQQQYNKYTEYSLEHKHNKNYYRNRFVILMIFCRYFYSFSLIFCGITLNKFSLLIKFLREKRRQVVTGTRRRHTVKNGAIIPNRKVEKKNHVIKQQKYDSLCVCVWRELTELRNRSLRWEEAAGSLSSKARACKERCRRAWESETERVKERALL